MGSVKSAVYEIVSKANRAVTVAEVCNSLKDTSPNSIYSAFESLREDKELVRVTGRVRKSYRLASVPSQTNRAFMLLSSNKSTGFRAHEVAAKINCSSEHARDTLEQLVEQGWISKLKNGRIIHYFYGEYMIGASMVMRCPTCDKDALHKKWGNGRVVCSECGSRRRVRTT